MTLKKIIFSVTVMMVLSTPALAGFERGQHIFKGSAGIADGIGPFNDNAGVGPAVGLGYRYQFRQTVSFGLDVNYSAFNNETRADGSESDVSLLSLGYQIRLDLTPTSDFVSFLSFAPTFNVIEEKTKTNGISSSNQEERAGWYAAFGFDHEFRKKWIWGAEGRYVKAIGQDLEAIQFLINLSWRTGEANNDADDW